MTAADQAESLKDNSKVEVSSDSRVTYMTFMNHSKSTGHSKPVPALWTEDIQTYMQWLRASDQSSRTINLRRKQLERLARSFPDQPAWELTLEDLAGWLADQNWSSDTLRSHRAAVSGLYRWGLATGRIDTNPSAALPAVKQTRPKPRPIPDRVTTKALLQADEREALMIRLARYAGMRACEIARTHSEDLLEDLTGWSLLVHGKGGHQRLIPLEDTTLVNEIRQQEGFCFPGAIDGHLSAARVSELLSESLPGSYTGHQLRHSFASVAYQQTSDIRAVQELLGHASLNTTQIYTAVPNHNLRAAVAAAGLGTHRPPRALAA